MTITDNTVAQAIARERTKLNRQEAAVETTKAFIKILESQLNKTPTK